MQVKPIEITWHPGLPIFASAKFLKAVSDQYGWLGGFDDSVGLRCFLPYTILKKGIFKLVRFRVETIPVCDDFSPEEEKYFLELVVDYFKFVDKADIIIPATTNTIFRTYPAGAIAAPYGTYKIDLSQPEDKIVAAMSASHRRKIRLALKSGLEIKRGLEYTGISYKLIKETFKRSKLGFMNYELFRKYLDGLGENVEIFICHQNNSVQSCIVIPFSNHSAYYVYGGSIPEPAIGATVLLHYEAIKYFKTLGVKYYDFVGVRINPEKGSKQEGLKQFKERFGGQLFTGYIWKYNLRSLRHLAYDLAIKLLRGGDIVDEEKHKLNQINISK